MNRQYSKVGYSYLFAVRLWREGRDNSNAELRGEVRHVLSGEMRYFREWKVLTTYLADKVNELEGMQLGEVEQD